MKAEQVDQALAQKFIAEERRLVFWHDENSEFADYIKSGLSGDLSDVQILNLAEIGGLSAKLRLEREDPEGKYLVYSEGEVPPAEEDWLLDIRLYSASFHADVASIWKQELELSSLSLRDHLKERSSFFASQERRKKLKRLVSPQDDESALDLKMITVLSGSSVAASFDVLRAICHAHAQEGAFDLNTPPAAIASFEKMGLLDVFWELMRNEFAYESDSPSVAGLLRGLFISELSQEAGEAQLSSLAHLALPVAARRNAVVFLTQWRDSSVAAKSYDAAAAAIAEEQRVDGELSSLDLESLRDVYTFWEAEKRVLSSLKDRLLGEIQSVDVDAIAELAAARKAGHWLSGPGSDSAERAAIRDAYSAVLAAAELFALHRESRRSLSFDSPGDLLTAYQSTLYQFDRLYRRFCTESKPARGQGWDLLKKLAEEVERVYDQGFLQPLGLEWSRLLDAGFLGEWSLPELPSQQDFYASQIKPHLEKSDRKRAFVIISDAFRYEAAQELTETLNGRYRMEADLSAMLGVLPSYTALGMASLLPHKDLAYSEKGEVLVDGRSVAGTEARGRVLADVEGMACKATQLRPMRLEEARAFTAEKRVVYIYHNVVDARGDSSSTEDETFDAVSDCIAELAELVQFCINKLNAAKVWVTADHGFLFQQEAPDETDKSKLSEKPTDTVKMKKRYVIGPSLGETPEAHYGSVETTSGAQGGMEFWVPRAANRFHFTGGARFVHGGAMPQEVVVPLVTATHVRGEERTETESRKVSVQVLGGNHKITTPTYRFELIQTEAVSERRAALTLKGAVYDGSEAVTSVETVTCDSDSGDIDERKRTLRFELRSGTYDKTKPYQLILRDAETDAQLQSVPVVIDRSFDDDF